MRTPNPDKTSLERAFEIAASGQVQKPEDIRKQLKDEGYDPYQVQGKSLLAQLREIMSKTKAQPQ